MLMEVYVQTNRHSRRRTDQSEPGQLGEQLRITPNLRSRLEREVLRRNYLGSCNDNLRSLVIAGQCLADKRGLCSVRGRVVGRVPRNLTQVAAR